MCFSENKSLGEVSDLRATNNGVRRVFSLIDGIFTSKSPRFATVKKEKVIKKCNTLFIKVKNNIILISTGSSMNDRIVYFI